MDDPTDNLLNGVGTDTDFIVNNGGTGNPYLANQTPTDAIDNGLVTAAPNAAGGTTAAYSPPGWLTSFIGVATGAAGAAGAAATQLAPLINGQPANAKVSPAAVPGPNGVVKAMNFGGLSPLLILAAIAGLLWFFLGRKKSR